MEEREIETDSLEGLLRNPLEVSQSLLTSTESISCFCFMIIHEKGRMEAGEERGREEEERGKREGEAKAGRKGATG